MKRPATIRKKVAPAALADAEKFLLPTYKRQPLVFTHGRGPYVFDSNGKRYIDFLGGIAVNGLGHAHPNIVKVIRRESARAIHLSNLFHNEFQGPLAKKLAEISGMDRIFFSNSGTEAIEGALKLARLYSRPADAPVTAPNPKHRILALEHSFHGRTFGAVSITATEKYRLPFGPVVPGVDFVKFNSVADLESKFDKNVCAVILETIQGEGGIHPVSEAFWNRARALTSQHDTLLIADEIQCGLGRTGRYFAYQKFSSKPDIVAVAKPLAAGLPLGAILASEAVAARVSPGVHGTTFGGGPMICAVALEFLKVLEKTKVLANAASRGAEIRAGIEKLASKYPFIKEVRGEGLMIGVELTVDGTPFVTEAMNRGLLINCTHEYTLRLLPAFIITAKQVREFLGVFEEVLGHVSKSIAATETARHAAKSAAR
ncbi:MAG TPA: aspartate aminotransferase family protein [Candidatus Dormibacteraeota bacterium]|jgi:acetylornithine/N-succinyldiaminopimelate aminotransferase|nr:aspartate aminotransferase family protein [Candidatus Dormibacteraeota bacterium]